MAWRRRKEHETHHVRASRQRRVERLARGQATDFDEQAHELPYSGKLGESNALWARKRPREARLLQRRALLVSSGRGEETAPGRQRQPLGLSSRGKGLAAE